ncbi:MAG: DMT family transporter [Candidatus Krumholzibacteria bacterium]|nr:DMT family transporter [Candidatus Krumholzibacteria bacterium]
MTDDSPKKTIPMPIMISLMVLLFVIWSNAFTSIKHLREVFSPMELVLARFLPFALFSLLFILSSGPRRRESLDILRVAGLKIIGMGIFGIAGYNYFLYVAQTEIKPGAAALLTTLSPLMTLILAVIFLREKVPGRRVAGIILAFAGLFVVVKYGRVGMGNLPGTSHADVRYALIATLAPLSWSIYTILGKDLVRTRGPFLLTCLSALIGTLPFLLLLDAGFAQKFYSMRLTHWLALGHLTILSTMVGFWLWNIALKNMPATSVSSFIYLNPPFAALFGWLFFHEEVTGFFLAGGAIVLAGLYLSQSKQ